MLAVCRAVGLTDKICLSTALPLPQCVTESFGLPTDDLCHFTTRGKAYVKEIGDRIYRALKRLRLRSQQDKRVSGVVNGTCSGVDLYRGQHFGPTTQKLKLLHAFVPSCERF